jgi:hypothetical protein
VIFKVIYFWGGCGGGCGGEKIEYYFLKIYNMDLITVDNSDTLANVISEQFDGHNVRVDADTGYICVSDICKAGNSRFSDYYKLKTTKKFILELSRVTHICTSKLVKMIKKGPNSKRGTWAHPAIVTQVANRISIKFGVKISIWIEEWKKNNQENEARYMSAVSNLEPTEINQKEHEIQERLQSELFGEIEVVTPFGRIDLLTDTEIIEIKYGDNWKNALGKILVYGKFYPNHTKVIHLFDMEEDKNISEFCKDFDIITRFE